MTNGDTDDSSSDVPTAVVLDYLPHGRSSDDRPQYEKEPLAFAVSTDEFRLYEMVLADDADISIGDRIPVDRGNGIDRLHEVDYGDLPGGAQSELEYVIEDIIDADTQRFVDFYNEAQPITTRLHALNLLPGIGKKLRNNILDKRKRRPFESFEDLQARVSGLHDPKEVLVERILEEISEADLKYRIFAQRDAE
jgi:putative nucleotide binding protein